MVLESPVSVVVLLSVVMLVLVAAPVKSLSVAKLVAVLLSVTVCV